MSEVIQSGMSLREEVEADLPDELVERFHGIIAAPRDPSQFRERLVHILTRYELYSVNAKATRKNDRRKQFTKLHDKASEFLKALDALGPDVVCSLEGALEAVTADKWDKWSFESDDSPVPEDDYSLEQARVAATRIMHACQVELDVLDATKGQGKKSGSPALEQFLIDLGALYESQTGCSAKSHCYRDETSEDEYNGKFFILAKAILDAYAPKSYATPAALGIRIVRLLADT